MGIKDKMIFFSDVLKRLTISSAYKTNVFNKLPKLMIGSSVFISVTVLCILIGLVRFVRRRKHILNSLLRLEFIILIIFCLIRSRLQNLGVEVYFLSFFLTIAACEGSLGLSLLVCLVRTHGNDYFNNFSVLLC